MIEVAQSAFRYVSELQLNLFHRRSELSQHMEGYLMTLHSVTWGKCRQIPVHKPSHKKHLLSLNNRRSIFSVHCLGTTVFNFWQKFLFQCKLNDVIVNKALNGLSFRNIRRIVYLSERNLPNGNFCRFHPCIPYTYIDSKPERRWSGVWPYKTCEGYSWLIRCICFKEACNSIVRSYPLTLKVAVTGYDWSELS